MKKRALGFSLEWEQALYLLLMLAAGALRLWDLGGRPIHFDESLHAFYSWLLATGGGYQHNPLMHGPFQFHGIALSFVLFGDSEFTARLLSALFGTALVALPYLLRRELGRWGALATGLMLAVSPTFLYFSRFARNDIFMAVWTILLVVLMWRYLKSPQPRYLYLSAAVLALSFSTKENTYLTVAILGSYLLLRGARDLWGRVREGLTLSRLSPAASYAVFLGTFTLPLLSAAATIPLRWLNPGYQSPTQTAMSQGAADIFFPVAVLLAFLALAAAVGLRWGGRRWLYYALVFYGIFVPLHATFGTNPLGLASGLWGGLDYWLAQQGVARGGQPWFYYPLLLGIYEFLPLLFGVMGALYFAVRGDGFHRFLVYWAGGSFLLYSLAAEKMPWLGVHLALPLILLAGSVLGRAGEGMGKEEGRLRPALLLAVGTILLVFTIRAAWMASYQNREEPVEMLVYSQGAPEVMAAAEDISRLLQERPGTPVTIDLAPHGGWPWHWLLRNRPISYQDLGQAEPPPVGALILAREHEGPSPPDPKSYQEPRTLRILLWFSEYYKDMTWSRLGEQLGQPAAWARWGRYFLFREIVSSGSWDVTLYLPK
ncbi:MAG: TIGR03663 family protein [Chloroflexi bacterium]|nr:TIGR03663 family protein [Chloroflexota bacterium]